MNIISKFVFIVGTLGVGAFLIFTTFMGGKEELMEDLSFKKVELGSFELIKDDEENFAIIEKNGNNKSDGEKIFVEQVSNTSRFFTNNEISEVILGKEGEESKINIEPQIYLNIEPGVYLFDLNEVNKNFVVDGGLFTVENKGPGSFVINNTNPSKTVIFSLDTIINLNIKNKEETLTSILLYPHSYIIFNQKRNFLVKNGDLLKVSSIFTLDFFGEKIFTEKLINPQFTDIITLRDETHKPFIENTLGFLASELEKKEKELSKYTMKDFLTFPGEIYIQKYFSLFVNEAKQKTYYKNIILRNIITLFHEEQESTAKINFIQENIKTLEQIDLDEAKKMKQIIYFYYLNNLKIKNSSIITAMNFSHLIQKIENNSKEIPKGKALFFLKNIFKDYDFLAKSNILEEISSFKEKYIGTELEYDRESPQHKEIEYLLFFLEKLLTTEIKDSEKYIDQISVILEDYTNISTQFYNSNNDSIKKTGLFKNSIVLGNISSVIEKTYFKSERTDEGLLERKDFNTSNNKINRNSITRVQQSVETLNDFYLANKQFLNETESNDAITVGTYIKHINMFREFFEALEDYEKYKSKYDTEKSIFLGGESITSNQKGDNTLSISKAYEYIKNFNGVSMNDMTIMLKNYDTCNNPLNLSKEKEDEEKYCYEIENLDINGNRLSFLLFPYEKNKISEISVNNIEKKGSYKLDDIQEELNEKIKRVTREEEKIKYDFRNFFVATFATQGTTIQKEIYENEENILQEDKVIKTFKRNKLLGDSGDFSILKGFLDIKYNDLIVQEDYSIFIKESLFNLSINTCRDENCENNFKQYEGTLESQYEFTNSHTFKKVHIKVKDKSYKGIEKYALGGNTIEIIGDIKVGDLKTEIDTLLSHISNLEQSIKYLKNNLKISNIKIKYYTYSKRTKIESNYKNKKLDIYIESGGKINIYYDGKRIHEQTLGISELENTLHTIK